MFSTLVFLFECYSSHVRSLSLESEGSSMVMVTVHVSPSNEMVSTAARFDENGAQYEAQDEN